MKYFTTFVFLLFIYVLLAGFELYEIILGSVVSLVLTLLVVKYVNFQITPSFPFSLVKFIVIYLPVFIWKLVIANLDMARRVLSPRIPLNPGIVKVKTNLKSDYGKVVLANSITLTPGTLTMDIIDDYLYVHTVDVKGLTSDEQQKNISQPFEKILGGIFK